MKEIKFQLTEKINQLENENLELKQSIHQQEELINQTKLQLNTTQNEKEHLEKQLQSIEELQTTISQLHTDLDHKVISKNIYFNYFFSSIE